MDSVSLKRRAGDFCVRNKAYLLSLFIPAALLFISYMLFGVYPFGERSVLALDLNAQYVYYYDYMYDVFAGRESLFYSWSRTFSGEFFGTFAYYLASPFNFIVWLFPRKAITEGLLTMLLVKSAAGGLTCCFLLKKHRGYTDLTATLFSVMYALSGYFTAHSINPMWLDGMIALPLVIIGVEKICNEKRFLLYALSMLYSLVSNFYIGYMVGIFSALYFVYYIVSGKIADKSGKSVGNSIIVYGTSSLCAVCMSCWIVLPVYKALQLGKLQFGNSDFTPAENFNLTTAFLKLFPATFDTIRPEGLPMLYCGLTALIFAVIYFTMKKIPLRQRISGGALLAVMLLSMYIKPVDMLWHGGKVPVWMPYRYSFTVILLLVMFGAEAFENVKQVRRKKFGAVFAALAGLLLLADHYEGSEHFNTTLVIVAPLIMLGIIAGALVFYRKYRMFRGAKITILALVCAELLVNNLVTFTRMHKDVYYSTRESYTNDIPQTRAAVNAVKALDSGFYRMEKTYHRCVNDPLACGLYGVSHSSSVFNSKAIALAKTLGFGAREHYSRYDGATPLTDDILGIKYILSKSELLSQYDSEVLTQGDITAYENADALGFAYLADKSTAECAVTDNSPFAAQENLAAILSGEYEKIFLPLEEYYPELTNLNAGSTTDAHLSYKKRLENEDANVTYKLSVTKGGRVYMYLPTRYERECRLYVNGEFIKYYFENENHSIAYLGEFPENETISVKLELVKNEVFYEQPQFRVLDEDALARVNARIAQMNENTVLTRTGKSTLSISLNAQKPLELFTTIPFEDGWTATIDGNSVNIRKCVNDTFMCVDIPAGAHTVEFKFFPAGLKTGLIVTACGAVSFIALLVISRILRKENSNG